MKCISACFHVISFCYLSSQVSFLLLILCQVSLPTLATQFPLHWMSAIHVVQWFCFCFFLEVLVWVTWKDALLTTGKVRWSVCQSVWAGSLPPFTINQLALQGQPVWDPERPCSPKTWSLLWTPDLALGAFVKIKCVFQKELEFSTRSPITLLGGQWGNEAQDGTSGRGWFLGWGAVEGDKPDWGARNQWLVSRLRAEFTRARCFRRMRMTPLLERLIPANWLVTWY